MIKVVLHGPKGQQRTLEFSRNPMIGRRYGITKGKTQTEFHFGNSVVLYARHKSRGNFVGVLGN